jgi:SAM-dependent methyltransferase
MPDPLAQEDFADWNEQMVQRYDPELFHHHPRSAVRWVESRRQRAVTRGLNVRPDNVVLDVGCGAGNLLAGLTGRALYGVDISEAMVKRAAARLAGHATITREDAEHLPFPDGMFDRVAASSVLSHVLHPEAVIAEIARVTKPGGRVVISISDESQIERGMRWAKMLRLHRLFLGNSGDAPAAPVYNVDYHLQRFTLPRLREVVGDKLHESDLLRVPILFPVHWVALYDR